MDFCKERGPSECLKRSGLSSLRNDGRMRFDMRYPSIIAVMLIAAAISAAAEPPVAQMESKSDAKVSCKLSPEQLQKQRHKLLPGLFKRADKRLDLTDGVDGVRLHLKQRPGLLAELARIIEREQDCCSFLAFNIAIEPSGGAVTFDITGPVGTRDMLKSL